MANDWIKMRSELQTHPKIVRILSAMGADKFRVIGGLHAVWSIFDAHSVDGSLLGYTPSSLDHVIGWEGFSGAMMAVGWLAYDGAETLSLPEFDEHNGQCAKRRAEDQKRKRDTRKSPQSVRNLSANDADEKRTREEKRREDKEKNIDAPAKPSPADLLSEVSEQVRADFIALRKAKKAAITQTAIDGIRREAATAGLTLERALQICCERGWQGFKAEWLPKAEVSMLPAGGRRKLA